jgi:uncharacterized protein
MDKPIHIAIVRRVKPGNEDAFRAALHEFIQASFSREGVLGAGILIPAADANPREYGILRTFGSEKERDSFYESPEFKAWQKRIEPWTQGKTEHRQLHGLEAWFHDSGLSNPPVWKMAILTLIAVWPISMAIPAILNPLIGTHVSSVLFAGAVAVGIVVALTWGAMPLLVKFARPWLQSGHTNP